MRADTHDRYLEQLVTAVSFMGGRLWDRELDQGAVATELACSTRHVQRLFTHKGTTFRAALHAMRMDRAAQLLSYGQRVRQVAHQVGYRPRHLATAFLRTYGATPSQVRHAWVLVGRLRRRTRAGLPRPTHARYDHRRRAWRIQHREMRRIVEKLLPGTDLEQALAAELSTTVPPLTPPGRLEPTSLSARADRHRT